MVFVQYIIISNYSLSHIGVFSTSAAESLLDEENSIKKAPSTIAFHPIHSQRVILNSQKKIFHSWQWTSVAKYEALPS